MHQCPDSGVCLWPTRISVKIAQEVIAEYTGKKAPAGWRPWVAVAGALALLAVWHWGSPTPTVSSPSSTCPGPRRLVRSRRLAAGRDSGPLGSASTPFLPLEPAKEAAFPRLSPPLSPRWRQWTCALSKRGSDRAGGAGSIRRLQPCRLCVDQAKQSPPPEREPPQGWDATHLSTAAKGSVDVLPRSKALWDSTSGGRSHRSGLTATLGVGETPLR